MLEKLFTSGTRVKLLKLFFNNEKNSYYVREIAKEIREHINSVRRELKNFKKLDLIKEKPRKGRKNIIN